MIKIISKEIPLDSTSSLLLFHPVCKFLYNIRSLSVFFHAAVVVSTFKSVRFINVCCIVSLWIHQKHILNKEKHKNI